jgi:UDP-GlcNAc:undecaprenyl-phosphate/decaprenyl-phosphate GlcNAc-1-phosphate transferase
MREYLLVMLVTAAVTYLLTPLVRRVAVATGAVHAPRARDTHTKPTPLLGGLAMYGGLVAGLIVASRLTSLQDPFQAAGSKTEAGLLLAGALVVVVGFIDDRWGLSAVSKLAGQVAAAGILVWSGQSLPWLPMPSGGVFSLEPDLSVTLTILLVVVTINAINFIDGLDGLAAGIVAVAALSFLVYSYTLAKAIGSSALSLPAVSSALLAGMCLGFLPHNFYPARIFMGDIGAMLLGLMLAYGPISSTASLDPALLTNYTTTTLDRFPTFLPLLVPAAIFVIPYADLMFAIVRRTRAGKPLMAADRQHLHHRVLSIGHSYRQSVLIMYLWAALFSVTVVSLSVVRTRLIVFVVATAVAVLTLLPVTMPWLRPWRLLRQHQAVAVAARRGGPPARRGTAPRGPAAHRETVPATPRGATATAPRGAAATAPRGAAATGRHGIAPALGPALADAASAAEAAGYLDVPAFLPVDQLPADQLRWAGRLPGADPADPFAPPYPVDPLGPGRTGAGRTGHDPGLTGPGRTDPDPGRTGPGRLAHPDPFSTPDALSSPPWQDARPW